MGVKNDYRVSTIVVLCKDCNQDVGLYPARHQCDSTKRPKLPTLYSSTSNSSWTQSPTQEEQRYPEPTHATGRKLWGKVKENEKYKELLQTEKKVQQEKPSSKLWEKIINVTMSNNSLYDDCPESDDDDWEGETHVSRILREYYESHRRPLPEWLLDDTTSIKTTRKQSRRLWQQDENISKRQKEILEIRKSSTSQNESIQTKHTSYNNDTLKNSNSSYALHQTHYEEHNTIKNSHSMPNVNESFGRSKSERKPSNFANVTLSMNNSLRHLKANTNSKYQYVSSTAKSLF